MSTLQGESLHNLVKKCIGYYISENKSPKTVKELRNSSLRFLEWLGARELTLTVCIDYQQYLLNEKQLKRSSVGTETGCLRMLLNWLYQKERILETDWARMLRKPANTGKYQKEPPEGLVAPDAVIQAIITVTTPGEHDHRLHRTQKQEYREFLIFLAKSGLRITEAINIKPRHVFLDHEHPYVQVLRKGGEWSPIALPLDFLEPIRQRIKRGRWFRVNERTCQIKMKQVSKIVGKRVTPHSFRKITDTGMLENGASIGSAAKHMGHTVAVLEKTYHKLSPKESSQTLNTYSPFIDRSKVPIEYSMKALKQTLETIKSDPRFSVSESEKEILIRW